MTVPVTVGLTQPDVLGTLSVGFLLDDGFAAQLKELTGSEIAFGVNGRVLSATLPANDRAALSSQLEGGSGPSEVRLHG